MKTKREETVRITFFTPLKMIPVIEQQDRKQVPSALECLIADFESRFRTDVVGIELYPCDSDDLVKIVYWTPQRQVSRKEEEARRYLKYAIETIILEFQTMFSKTDVTDIQMYPCGCRGCRQAAA